MISGVIAGSALCRGTIVVVVLSLSLLPDPTSSFAWSSSPSKTSPPPVAASRRRSISTRLISDQSSSTRRWYQVGGDDYQRPIQPNATDYAGPSWRRTTTTTTTPSSCAAATATAAAATVPFDAGTSTTTTLLLLHQHLLDVHVAHLAILKSMDDGVQPAIERIVVVDETMIPSSIPHDGGTDVVVDVVAPSPRSRTKATTTMTTPFSKFDLSDEWRARLLLLLSAALYGTNFSLVKSIDEIRGMSVGMASTLRFGMAAFAMLPMLFAPIDAELRQRQATAGEGGRRNGGVIARRFGTDKNFPSSFGGGIWEEPTRLSAGLAGMEIGLYNSIGYLAQAVGLKTTTASKSAFICSMAVVTVPILDFMWGKKLLRRQVIGACLAAFGVFALELGGQQTTIADGDLMSLIQPVVFGLGFWRMEAAMEKYPTEAGRLAAAQLLTVFLVSLAYLVCWPALGIVNDLPLVSDACNAMPTASEIIAWLSDPRIVGMFVWTGLITTAFTIWMETLALRTLSASETTLIFSTEPLFGAAFAAVVANECLGVDDAVGAFFIILGCVVSGIDVGQLFVGRAGRPELEAGTSLTTPKK
ncbi:hypothetical protein ACHAXA_005232 [Cyclostephanos tholiformis]|uniref:EamA domain-containing protein n=1 Tax=Cyclostephanos tholiformis TaxID=382380 RepID=A0ABD3SER0_9STRA